MKKGKLSNGFKFNIDESVFNDYQFLVILRKYEDNAGYIVDLVSHIFGDDEKQHDAFLESCKDESGRILSDTVITNVEELFDLIGADAKN